jgi:(2R)-ethylmalonyl-CoA mutase
LTPAEIVNAAVQEGVHVVGLSILSGSHKPLVAAVIEGLKTSGIADVPVVVVGIMPPEDAAALKAAGVSAVYTPKDFDLNAIMADIAAIVERGSRWAASMTFNGRTASKR